MDFFVVAVVVVVFVDFVSLDLASLFELAPFAFAFEFEYLLITSD